MHQKQAFIAKHNHQHQQSDYVDDLDTAIGSKELKQMSVNPFMSHTPKIRFNSITNSIDMQSEYTKDMELKKSKEFVE